MFIKHLTGLWEYEEDLLNTDCFQELTFWWVGVDTEQEWVVKERYE